MRVHLIGSEGVSMKWIADRLRFCGKEVSGSDMTTGGHNAANVKGADLVVYTSAIQDDNPELVAAREAGIPCVKRAEFLGDLAAGFDEILAVAGTHGKTTVTAMLAEMLSARAPAVHIGGTVGGKRGSAVGHGLLIAEACEYRRAFLYLRANIAIVLNVELDHTDYYKNYNEVLSAFSEFTSAAETAVVPDSLSDVLLPAKGGRQVSVGPRGSWALLDSRPQDGGSVLLFKTPDGMRSFFTPLTGRHNALDALFATAAAREYGADYKEIESALARFNGADRRMQRVGKMHGLPVFSDYAHHPTEIRATLDGMRCAGFERPLVVFQPHTYARLNSLFEEFVNALGGADSVILPVFNARGKAEGKGSEALSEILGEKNFSSAAKNFEKAARIIKSRAAFCDAVVVMGAGDNEKLIPLIIDPIYKYRC